MLNDKVFVHNKSKTNDKIDDYELIHVPSMSALSNILI